MQLKLKKALALCLSMVLLISAFPLQGLAAARAVVGIGECGKKLTWKLYSDGELIIEGTGEMDEYAPAGPYPPWKDLIIKKVTIKNGVLSISPGAFYDDKILESITISNSVNKIGWSAFAGCTALTSINIPNKLTEIPKSAFSNCTSLKSISIPNSVTKISNYAFNNCTALESISIPSSVTEIGENAFHACISLKSVSIFEGVKYIEWGAFDGCSALKTISIPDSIFVIRENAFDGCSSLASINVGKNNLYYSSLSGVLYNKDRNELLVCPEGKTGDCKIPNSVVDYNLNAFKDCKALTSISISNNMTYVPYFVFEGCTSLKAVNAEEKNHKYSSIDGVFFNYDKTELIYCPGGKTGAYKIPDSVTKISEYAFKNCNSLTSISIPASATSIGREAFKGCSALKSISIPDGVKEIKNDMFSDCSSLETISIPDGITAIEEFAFEGCIALESISIPNSVTRIDQYAFADCAALKSITIPNSVKNIGNNAFSGCTSLNTISVPDSVTKIGKHAFMNCTSLTAINVSKNNAKYSSIDGVLLNKNKTELINYPISKLGDDYKIPNSVKSISISAFNGCTALKSIIIPIGLTKIGWSVFEGCTSLESLIIPDKVTEIGDGAFIGCTSLKEIYIPDKVTELSGYNFKGCSSLTAVNIGRKNTKYLSIDGVLFNKDKTELVYYPDGKTGAYTIPDTVTKICEPAFSNCKPLTSILIPNTVTNIENNAFENCMALNSVFIPNKVTNIGMEAFKGCSALKSISIPDSITYIDGSVFDGINKKNLTIFCEEYSHAHKFAASNGISTKPLDEFLGNKISFKSTKNIKIINIGDSAQGLLINNTLTAKGIKALTENKDLTIKDKDGKEIKDGELVGSGATINLIKDSKVIDKYTIVVLGDTNGDGKIAAADARLALRMSARLENPKAWQFEAAARANDINAKPEKITAAMARKILRVSAKLEKF